MASRRCLSTKIVCTDSYAELSYAEQSMYIQLYMSADDDGIVIGPGLIAARYRQGKTLLQKLTEKGYLLLVDGVYIITHWRVANTLKTDRLKPLDNPDVAAKIWIKPNRMYTDQQVPNCITLFQDRTMGKVESKNDPNENITQPNVTQPNTTHNITEFEGNTAQIVGTDSWDMEMYYQQLLKRYPSDHIGDLKAVRKAYDDSIVSKEDAQKALCNLDAWIVSSQWANDDGRYIPDMSSWIIKQRWKYAPASVDKEAGVYQTSKNRWGKW